MRINLDKYPILKVVKRGYLDMIGLYIEDEQAQPEVKNSIQYFGDCFNEQLPYFRTNVKYISTSLFNSLMLAFDKLMSFEILKGVNDSGTLIFNDFQIFYKIKFSHQEQEHLHFESDYFVFHGYNLVGIYTSHEGNSYRFSSQSITYDVDEAFLFTVLILNFIKYAEVEIKELAPNRQIWQGVNCLYNNKLDVPIQIIDSTWFTTIVQSEGFKVRGHFRLQSYGEGFSKRKLIWIDEFKKDGYTMKAKILAN
jgi:hypothetical protein